MLAKIPRMKKKLMALIPIVFSTIVYSQEHIAFGVKTGLNLAHATGKASSSDTAIGYDEGRTAFHAGIIAELSLSETLSIQTELLYAQQGASYFYDNRSSDGSRVDSELNLDYITLPILAKYEAFNRFSLEFGPQIGYMINSEIDNETLTSGFMIPQTLTVESINIKEDVNNFDVGVALGMGYELDSGLLFQARYVLGLTEVFKNSTYTTSTDLKNAVFQLSMGYKF